MILQSGRGLRTEPLMAWARIHIRILGSCQVGGLTHFQGNVRLIDFGGRSIADSFDRF